LAFFSGSELKMVPLQGGTAQTVSDAANPRGGVFAANDSIIFTPGTDNALFQVPVKGGERKQISTLNTKARERTHRWPAMLPDGRSLLFCVAYETGNPLDNADVAVLDLDTGQHKVLIKGASYPRYSPTGHIIYATRRGIFAVGFDATAKELTGPPFMTEENVVTARGNGRAQYSFSATGDLSFIKWGQQEDQKDENDALVWIDRKGQEEVVAETPEQFSTLRLTSDQRTLFLEISQPESAVWSYDMERGTLSRLTQKGVAYTPIPDPVAARVAYEAVRDGAGGVMLANSDGSNEVRLTTTKLFHYPSSWSPDGKILALTAGTTRGFSEIWFLEVGAGKDPEVFISGDFNAGAAAFSPDGKWIAYVSDESGREEIYVRRSDGSGQKSQISVKGGIQPVWAKDGRELFFRTDREFFGVKINLSDAVSAGKPEVLFSRAFQQDISGEIYNWEADYDVSRSGDRFLFARQSTSARSFSTRVIFNWFESLRQASANAGK
jgi:Tol biopolymer transport system component